MNRNQRSPEAQALNDYIEKSGLTRGQFSIAVGYCNAAAGAWCNGKCRVPRIVLIVIGYYPPAHSEEEADAAKYRFAIKAKLDEIEAKKRERQERLKFCGYPEGTSHASTICKSEVIGILKRYCYLLGFITKRGSCDRERLAAHMNMSICTVSDWFCGKCPPGKRTMEKIMLEIAEMEAQNATA